MSGVQWSPIKLDHVLFERPRGGKVKITGPVLKTWTPHVQDSGEKLEAGGILLGRRILDSRDVIVDAVTEPGRTDRRKRFSFFRSTMGHQERIERAWRESDGAVNYLGEWHTHPETTPSPSCVDRWDWKRLVRAADFEGEELFFFIVGTHALGGWEVHRGDRRVRRLSLSDAT